MAQGNAFNTQGAVPSGANRFIGALSTPKTTQVKSSTTLPWNTLPKPSSPTAPVSSLNAPKLNSSPFGDTNSGIIGGINKATGLLPQPKIGTNPGMLPSTPVKKITAVDGSTTEFHAPATNTASQQPVQTTSPASSSTPISSGTTTPSPSAPAQNPYTPGNSSQAGFIGNVAQAGQSTPEENYWKDQYQKSVAGTQFGKLAPYAEAGMNVGKTPEQLQGLITAPDLAGRSAGDNGLYNALGSAYGNAALAGLSASQTDAARNLTANTSAASLTAPTGNIINVNPQTGLPVAGGSLTDLAKTAGQVQGLQSGAAATAAAGGNIAAQNATALGTASTAANAQTLGTFTNQINTTQKSVDTLNGLANQIVPNMGTTGFNPTSSPIGNQSFAQYFTEKNPAAKAGLVAGLGEIKNQISNVIASATGLTPSGVTAVTDTYDLTTLNPQQLNDFLQYINQYAQTNISAAQKGIDRINSGGSVISNPGLLPAPTPNSTGQAALGTGATLAKGLVNKIVSSAGNVVAGAVGGAIEGAF